VGGPDLAKPPRRHRAIRAATAPPTIGIPQARATAQAPGVSVSLMARPTNTSWARGRPTWLTATVGVIEPRPRVAPSSPTVRAQAGMVGARMRSVPVISAV
jgi:hypothetical protein